MLNIFSKPHPNHEGNHCHEQQRTDNGQEKVLRSEIHMPVYFHDTNMIVQAHGILIFYPDKAGTDTRTKCGQFVKA